MAERVRGNISRQTPEELDEIHEMIDILRHRRLPWMDDDWIRREADTEIRLRMLEHKVAGEKAE